MRRIEDQLELDDGAQTGVRYEPGSGKYLISQEIFKDRVHCVLLYADEAKKLAEWILKKERKI